MREERLHQDQEAVQKKLPDPQLAETTEDRGRFTSAGPFPDVAATHSVMQEPTASERAYGEVPLGPGKDWPKLLLDFFAKFPGAARQIAKQPSSLAFVKDCEVRGAKFGGYAEEGPDQDTWPYTHQDTVYIPAAHSDPIEAMSDFLFELNNAIRFGKFFMLELEAKKGAKSKLDARTYARQTVALEVEGMLKLGEVWFASKKEAGKENDRTWASHDQDFYLQQYLDFKAGKLTKDQIIDQTLHAKYTEGDQAGMTAEQFYMDQFNALNRPTVPSANKELMKP